jgi:hypothetical protein
MEDVSVEEDIKRRAHELWELAGRPEGGAEDFWYKAEEQVKGERATLEKLRADPTVTTNS